MIGQGVEAEVRNSASELRPPPGCPRDSDIGRDPAVIYLFI